MTKEEYEELEIDNKRLDFNEKVQFVVKKEELKEQNIRLNRLCFDYLEKEKRIAELEKENAELKEVHESDKRSLALIAKKGADFEKAYNEAEELLDKQIEATYKLFEENKELKRQEQHKQFIEDLNNSKKRIAELETQIEKMKSDVELARDNANKTEDWETFSVLNSILEEWEKVE